jgi:hypothetical protein
VSVLNPQFYLIHSARFQKALVAAVLACLVPSFPASPPPVETMRSVAALPPHLVGRFGEPAGFQQAADSAFFVFDRRGHTIFRVDAAMTSVTPLIAIGHELGRILQPFGFELGEGELAVADAPRGGAERVQVFTTSGSRLSAFTLPTRTEPRVQLDGLVMNGVGSMRFTADRTVLLSQPDTGSLFTEYDIKGRPLRSVGALRATPHDADPQLRLALNAGLPLPIPGGGFYFVFQAGEPRFRKYDAKGALMFERAIQGLELDALLQSQPTTWPRRAGLAVEIPVVRPLVRTAAVDPSGQLWVSLTVPFTYVYDSDGEKTRTVQLHGAGVLTPTSLFFARDGRLLVTPGCYIFGT